LRDFLLNYAYPGNIRELRNVMYRVSCLAGDMADVDHLPQDMRPTAPGAAAVSIGAPASGQEPISVANLMSLSDAKRAASDDAEKAFLERGLREVSGTVAELARRIDMNRSHLQMLLKKHGLHSKDFRNRNAPAASRNGSEDERERDEEDGET
jgi:DNA-binding NtrC family response regulator